MEEYFCNEDIHNYLRDEYILCPFCYLQLEEYKSRETKPCCDNKELILDNGFICKNCGIFDRAEVVNSYFNVYEKMYCIRKKTLYNRKYHTTKILNNLNITCRQKETIQLILRLIDKQIISINNNYQRKRIINIKFIIYKILQIMNVKHSIQLTSVQKTLNYYENYWNDIFQLIDSDIQTILKRKCVWVFYL